MNLVVRHGREVVVPNITGLNFDSAREQCKKLDLYVKQVDKKYNNSFERGSIINQKPNPNINTKRNSTIEVIVSLGPELVKVPYLDNITIQEARIRLNNANLKLGTKGYRYSSDVKKGKIISSSPIAEDLVPKGSKVKILISLGEVPTSNTNKSKYLKLLDNLDD
jgi:serine/threonine-protein kinase